MRTALRARVPDLAAGALAIDLAGQSEFGSLIGREGRLVRVEVSAPDRPPGRRAGPTRARAALAALPPLADVRDAYAGTQPMVEITLERERIAQRGLVDRRGGATPSPAGSAASRRASCARPTAARPITVRYAGSGNEDLADRARRHGPGRAGGAAGHRSARFAIPIEVVRVDQRPVRWSRPRSRRGGTARAVTASRQRLAPAAAPRPASAGQITGADLEQRRTLAELSWWRCSRWR